ncbi:AraC family transcriptional regulator [Maribacter polysiphoniae]|uniref:AraC family transcriptional regulator n=1 Tax=Maribacter polysiphoniae TaxID=429344 RepID=A0A316DVQ6_9FLAO|nr:helix-turn-helix domain-containing protein [Maribacter polysiphoniae]MBD1262211.1 AraC family transcriptional regulator [Maribacter polysiphoniae]PWK21528.1 AraC-like DNA-binding protein [Maribacter polysiphoniae]
MQNFFLVLGVFGMVLAISFFARKSVNRYSTFFLGAFYAIFSIYTFQTYVIESGLLLKFKWFYVWPLPLYNLIAVPIFFYFLTLIKDGFVWRWRYLLVFIPFIIGFVDVVNVYVKPQEVYDTIIENAYAKPGERLAVQYGLFNINQHYAMRFLWQFLALISLLPLLLDFIRNLLKEKDRKLLIWVIFLYVLFILMSILATMFAFEKLLKIDFLRSTGPILRTVNFVFYVVLFAIGIMPIYFPSILYGYPRSKKNKIVLSTTTRQEELKFGLDVDGLLSQLNAIKESGSFYEQDFDLTSCAKALEIPPHHLSYFLNQHLGLSFSAYRNNLRIEKGKTLITLGYLERNTMEALAQQCGFANRSSFSKTFKKITSMNVTEFSANSR